MKKKDVYKRQIRNDGESKPYGQWKSKRKREAGLRDLCAAPVFPADHSCGECAPGKNDRTGIYPAVPGYRKLEQSEMCIRDSTDSEQVTSLGYCVKYAQRHLLDGTRTLQEVVAMLEKKIEKESLAALCESTSSVANLARPRTQEIFACFDRYRGLKL